MKIGETYTRVITNFNKEGNGFTSTSGAKFNTYRVMLAGEISSYLLVIPAERNIEQYDEIEFKLTVGRGGMIRLTQVKFKKDINYSYDVNKALKNLFENNFDS